MAVDGVGSTSQLLAALRAEVARKTERNGAKASSQTEHTARTGKSKHDKEKLRAELRDITRNAPLDDEEAMKRIRRRMVHSMLLWEFGDSLREHPEWGSMLESITSILEASPLHLAAFDAVIR